MIIATAPTRISLFGGGSDLPVFYHKYGGKVLNMAINLRQTITIDEESTFRSIPDKSSIDFYNAFFDEFKYKPSGFMASFDGIIESGLGSSASAAVALVGALNKKHNLKMERHEIANLAWDIEVNKIGLYGGKQDQLASVYGGVNIIDFKKNGVIDINPISRQWVEWLVPNLQLFYTGSNRKNTKIQEGFRSMDQDQEESLSVIKDQVDEGMIYIRDRNLKALGELLDRAWHHKKKSNKGVTSRKIDGIYKKAIKQGALGGKILGSGGGGYMIFISKEPLDLGLKRIDYSICWQGLEVKEL